MRRSRHPLVSAAVAVVLAGTLVAFGWSAPWPLRLLDWPTAAFLVLLAVVKVSYWLEGL